MAPVLPMGTDHAHATARIVAISLECQSLSTGSTEIEIERRRAVADILDQNSFSVTGKEGPYALSLSSTNDTFAITANCIGAGQMHKVSLPLDALKNHISDYAQLCEDFFKSARTGQIAKLEVIDTARRKINDAAALIITDKLQNQIALDNHTARRLFILLYVLYMKNSLANI